jgi:two-component sensor histidine kinase
MSVVSKLFVICFIFLSAYSKGELNNNNDSVYNDILKKCISHAKTNFDSACYYGFQLNNYAQSIHNDFCIQDSYHQLGNVFFYANKFDKTIYYYQKAADINKLINNNHFLVIDYVDISFAYIIIGKEMYEQAKYWNDKAMEIASKSADSTLIYYYSRSGIFHLKTKNLEKSLFDFKQVYNYYLLHKLEFRGDMFCSILNNIGVVYQKMNLLDSSIYYFQKSYQFPNKLPYNLSRSISIVNYGISLKLKGNYLQAIQKTHEGIYELKTFHLTPKILEGYNNLEQCFEKLGRFDSALFYNKIYNILKDSVFTQDTKKQIAAMESQQALEKSNKEIAVKNLELEKEKGKKKIVVLVLILIAITALAVTLAYFIIRSKNKLLNKNEKEIKESLYEKELLLSEVHHRVKNNLQLVSSMLDLQQKYLKDEEAINAINNSKNRVQSMSLIHQTLYQNGKYGYVDTKDYITKVANVVLQSLKMDVNIKIDFNLDSLLLLLDYAIPLGLITNELITNAVKYAFKNKLDGKIFIELKKIDDYLVLKVEDDGIGVNEIQMTEAKSFGLKLIKSLCRQIDAEFVVKNENGTKISLIIRNFKLYEQV